MICGSQDSAAAEPQAIITLPAVHVQANDCAQPADYFRLGYRRWLDGLRGVAILLVLAAHVFHMRGGPLGVDIFFVLSGFLITCLLVEEWQKRGAISLKHFYLRRGLRLLPAFFLLLTIAGVEALLLHNGSERMARLRAIAVSACYISNWSLVPPSQLFMLGHTWSLSLEEQFYLLWPVCLFTMLRAGLSKRTILFIVGGAIVLCCGHRLMLLASRPAPGPEQLEYMIRMYVGSDTRADSLLVGCAAALLVSWRMLPRSRRFVFWTGLISLISALFLGYLAWRHNQLEPRYHRGLFTVVAVMVAIIIIRMLSGPSRLGSWFLESVPLVGIGRISYGVYLFHSPMLTWLWPRNAASAGALDAVLILGATLVVALLSYYCVERPCLRLKSRFQTGTREPRAQMRRATALWRGWRRRSDAHAYRGNPVVAR
jgi:peptidoglycan/LPS O-acetylase OafA/YrhL